MQKPLLFVQGPPVYTRIVVVDEESTSVFVMKEEERTGSPASAGYIAEPLQEVDDDFGMEERYEAQPAIRPHKVMETLAYLNNPFRRQAYSPLTFILPDERIKGTIRKMEEDTIWVDPHGVETDVMTISAGEIESILWRGQPFEIND